MTPNFIIVVNDLSPICCHIGPGMPYLRILIEDMFVLLSAMTVIEVRKLTCGRNENISNDQVKFSANF